MKLRRGLAIILAAVLVSPLLVAVEDALVTPTRANAVVGVDFNPGNIISDALFFDGNAMTAAQVQDFLYAQEAPCAPNIDCAFEGLLRTPTMAAETGLCNAYAGAAVERVADVIAKVGQACGVSQKVLMVLIQKEQHLISSSNPTQRMYDKATGFACPDTAPCDAAYSGFFFQVWYAARQFKYYAYRPLSFNHQPGRFNNVRFNPDAGCGSSSIFIANQATAGLYNYTPYQPNAAALTDLYGEGDYCSAHGNRNFWTIYTDWFGPTNPPTSIQILHQSLGGNSGPLGPAMSEIEFFAGSGGGTGQRFQNGSVMSSPTAGTFAIFNGAIRNAYFAAGGPSSSYGWPTAPQTCVAGSCSQQFQGGMLGKNPIAALYESLGGAAGSMGAAQGGYQSFTGSGGGTGQRFVNGSIMSSPTAGTFAIMNGPIRDQYFAAGGPSSSYGWPTAAQVCASGVCSQAFQGGTIKPGPIAQLQASLGGDAGTMGPAQSGIETFSGRGGGTGQRFLNGSIMSSPTAGTFAIMNGSIRNQYFAAGGPSSSYGWPTAAQVCTNNLCTQQFQGGAIGPGPIAQLQASLGGDSGAMGPAQSGIETFTGRGGGTGQRFLNGSIMSSPTAGTFAIMNGSIRNQYFAAGGPSSSYGWPTAAQVCTGTTCTQQFQGGSIGPDAIAQLQASLGGDAGAMGPAQSGIETFTGRGGGTGQRFLNGSIMSSPTAGTFAIMNGPIRDQYFRAGGPSSGYGWPTAAQVCTGTTCTQQFQGGSIGPDPIAQLQVSLGGDAGAMGPAQSGIETFTGRGGGTGQRFLNGSIMSSPTAGTFAIMNGSIRNQYFAAGGPSSSYGWPTAAQVCTGATCSQQFQGGTITTK